MEMVEAQPLTGSPKIRRRITTKIMAKIDRIKLAKPAQVARLRGASEKLINPSME